MRLPIAAALEAAAARMSAGEAVTEAALLADDRRPRVGLSARIRVDRTEEPRYLALGWRHIYAAPSGVVLEWQGADPVYPEGV